MQIPPDGATQASILRALFAVTCADPPSRPSGFAGLCFLFLSPHCDSRRGRLTQRSRPVFIVGDVHRCYSLSLTALLSKLVSNRTVTAAQLSQDPARYPTHPAFSPAISVTLWLLYRNHLMSMNSTQVHFYREDTDVLGRTCTSIICSFHRHSPTINGASYPPSNRLSQYTLVHGGS